MMSVPNSSTIKSDFQEFIFSNNIIVAAASWTIGISTKDLIEGILNNGLLPLILYCIHKVPFLKTIHDFTMHLINNHKFFNNLGNLVWIIVLWGMTIFLTFFILEFIFNRYIVGMKTLVKEEDKVSFVTSKLEAKDPKLQSMKRSNDEHLEKVIEHEIEKKNNTEYFDNLFFVNEYK